MKPSGRALEGLPSALSLELVSVGMGASRTEEGRELATAEMSEAGAVVVGVLPEELPELLPEEPEELPELLPEEVLSSSSSSSYSSSSSSSLEVSMGALPVAVGAAEPVMVMVVVQGVVAAAEDSPAKVGSPVVSEPEEAEVAEAVLLLPEAGALPVATGAEEEAAVEAAPEEAAAEEEPPVEPEEEPEPEAEPPEARAGPGIS